MTRTSIISYTVFPLILFCRIVSWGATADSTTCARLRDSLRTLSAGYAHAYQEGAAAPDSIYIAGRLSTRHVFSSDAYTWTGLAEALPGLLPIRHSIASSLDRTLTYGFPAPIQGYATSTTTAHTLYAHGLSAAPASAKQLQELSMPVPGHLRLQYHPRQVLHPHLCFLWENGLFNENVLDARFVRPVSPHAWLGVFVSNRFFNDQRFDHSPGDIYNFYKSIFPDSTQLMNEGYNPLVDEKRYTARLTWRPSARRRGAVSYTYGEYTNQRYDITTADTHAWQTLIRYLNTLHAEVHTPLSPRMPLDATLQVRNNGYGIRPSAQDPVLRGGITEVASGLTPQYTLGSDTLALCYRAALRTTRLYQDTTWHSQGHTLSLRNTGSYRAGMFEGRARSSLGLRLQNEHGARAATPVWLLHNRLRHGIHTLSVFGTRQCVPYTVPLDLRYKRPGYVLDPYYLYGAHYTVYTPAIHLTCGYLGIHAIDSTSVHHGWWHAITPYAQPAHTLLIAPGTGRWKGFRLHSRILIADTRPYIKSTTGLHYELRAAQVPYTLTISTELDYWSGRAAAHPGAGAHPDTWQRPIYDVGIHSAIQIKSFRLFYKIDNFLNRKIAYMPGYPMPGLTFRWGFNWYLPQ
jgi:hypothetical protein